MATPQYCLQAFRAGAESAGGSVLDVFLPEHQIHPCMHCVKCRQTKICTQYSDSMHLLYPQVQKASALALASPTISYNLTAWTKAFLERLNCFYGRKKGTNTVYSRLADRPRKAVVMAVGAQLPMEPDALTLAALRRPLIPLGYDVVGEMQTPEYGEPGEVRNDRNILQQAYFLGVKLARESKGPTMA